MKNILLFIAAAAAEIGGCYFFWLWLKRGGSPAWGITGVGLLIAFAWFLTRIDMEFAGRSYAAYGGIYIAAALLWLWQVEGAKPDRWDLIGVAICLVGVAVIVFGPRDALLK
jgi:small multidrug resistance family-3 protein